MVKNSLFIVIIYMKLIFFYYYVYIIIWLNRIIMDSMSKTPEQLSKTLSNLLERISQLEKENQYIKSRISFLENTSNIYRIKPPTKGSFKPTN